MSETLYLITARGGSKGVPGKNLHKIGGLSLVGWKARAALECEPGCRLVISTDCLSIAEEAARHGAVAPFMRPDFLATDTATSADVVTHALDTLMVINGEHFEHVMLLEPSTPFTTARTLRYAMTMMTAMPSDLIVGMREVAPHSTYVSDIPRDGSINPIIEKMRKAGGSRRQDFHREWTMSGGLYLFSVPMFLETNDIYGGVKNRGHNIGRFESIEIDTPEDLAFAEFVYERGYVGRSPAAEEDAPAAAAIA